MPITRLVAGEIFSAASTTLSCKVSPALAFTATFNAPCAFTTALTISPVRVLVTLTTVPAGNMPLAVVNT